MVPWDIGRAIIGIIMVDSTLGHRQGYNWDYNGLFGFLVVDKTVFLSIISHKSDICLQHVGAILDDFMVRKSFRKLQNYPLLSHPCGSILNQFCIILYSQPNKDYVMKKTNEIPRLILWDVSFS